MPQLVNRAGDTYRTEDPAEVIRMRARGFTVGSTPDDVPPPVADTLFHPGDKKVPEVLDYLAANPGDAERVIAEEKAGQARVSIVGDGG